jgi:hypothetical protein
MLLLKLFLFKSKLHLPFNEQPVNDVWEKVLNELNANLLDVKADAMPLRRVYPRGADNRLGEPCYYITEGSIIVVSKVTPRSLRILYLVIRHKFSLKEPTTNFSVLYIWEPRPTGPPPREGLIYAIGLSTSRVATRLSRNPIQFFWTLIVLKT